MKSENNKQYEIVKFKLNDSEMDIFISIEEETVWLTQDQISLLFKKSQSAISRHISNIFLTKECERDTSMQFLHKSSDIDNVNHRNPIYYNLDVILAVGYRVRSQNGILLKNFLGQYLREYYNKVDNPIIIYDNGDISLPVNISPSENTVWLSKDQLEILFNTTRQNIEYHIENIYSQEELIENSTCKDFLQVQLEGDRKVTRISKMYNLDMIISLGYRINTKNGITFRCWATKVLRQYLLKGYVIDEKRTLVTNENYINLIHEVNDIKKDVIDIKDKINTNSLDHHIVYEGEYYDGFSFINKLICSAKNEVVVIDGYADDSIFDYFVNSTPNIKKTIITHKVNRISPEVLSKFVKQYGNISIKEDKSFHDRFLFIDNDVYIIGASLNSLGRSTSVIKFLGFNPLKNTINQS